LNLASFSSDVNPAFRQRTVRRISMNQQYRRHHNCHCHKRPVEEVDEDVF
jgi:hypothetical protein